MASSSRAVGALARSAFILAVRALNASRPVVSLCVALVVTCVLAFVGVQAAVEAVAGTVVRLTQGDGANEAVFDLARCDACRRSVVRDPPRADGAALQLRMHASLPIRRVARLRPLTGSVPLVCYPRGAMPPVARWILADARHELVDGGRPPFVLAGATLLSSRLKPGDSLWVRTADGPVLVAGVLLKRAPLSVAAAENGSFVVPSDGYFRTRCGHGRAELVVRGTDSLAVAGAVSQLEADFRSILALRPVVEGPWHLSASDRFAQLVRRLVARVSRWIIIVPLLFGVLCVAGVFSVVVLDSANRLQEFGVLRAVGATRATLCGQLVVEASLIAVAGLAIAWALLFASGLAASMEAAVAVRLLVESCLVAGLTVCLGVLGPGVLAVRSASIASLEGRVGL